MPVLIILGSCVTGYLAKRKMDRKKKKKAKMRENLESESNLEEDAGGGEGEQKISQPPTPQKLANSPELESESPANSPFPPKRKKSFKNSVSKRLCLR